MAGPTSGPHRRQAIGLAVLVVAATAVSTLALATSPPADRPVYGVVRDWGLLDVLAPLGRIRGLPVLLALSVGVLAVLLLRRRHSRGLFVASAAAVVLAWGLAVLLPVVAQREPPLGSSVASADSYPSPSALVLSALALVLPAALRVPVPIRWVVSVVGWTVVLLVGLQEVHAGLRWPFDVVGGVSFGGIVVLSADLVLLRTRGPLPRPPVPAGEALRLGDRRLYVAASGWALGLVVVLGALAATRGIPRTPESGVMGTGLEVPLNLGLLVLLLVGVAVARWWHATGAVIVAVAAVLLGYASSVQYAPWVALLVMVAGFTPALLLWVEWHRVATVGATLGLAAFVSVLLAGGLWATAVNYTSYWGPTHPASATAAPSHEVVEWMWSGAVTTDAVTVRARTEEDGRVRLVLGTAADLSDARYSSADVADAGNQGVVSFRVGGLEPDTRYYYTLEVDGSRADRVAQFRTFPVGAASFRFAVGADSYTGSNGKVFDAVRATEPLLYLNVGDFFYGDVDANEPARYRAQYEANLTAPAQAALYASTAVAYVWGDHDFAGNDADRSAPGKPAALAVYRQYVPHYPLVMRDPQGPITQAFTVGRVRFILTDNRSQRDAPGTEPRWMLGPRQHAWLVRELAHADDYALVVWANADPWVDAPDPTTDTWGAFDWERRRLAQAITDHGVDNLLMVSGDAHMLAYDDGTHTNYAGTGRGFPLFHAAALDRRGSVKGGPYTGPVIPGGGQFGTVDVRDDGERVTVVMRGRSWRGGTLFTRRFTVP